MSLHLAALPGHVRSYLEYNLKKRSQCHVFIPKREVKALVLRLFLFCSGKLAIGKTVKNVRGS